MSLEGNIPRVPEGNNQERPRIVVHGSVVDFGDVRFGVEVYSDYQFSYIDVINPEGLTEEEKAAKISKALPWIDRVLNYTLGSWGDATFKPEGMELIDEVRERGYHSGYWTFPAGGKFREDAILPEYYKKDTIPREWEGISVSDAPDNW